MRLRTVALVLAPTALWLAFGGASSAQLDEPGDVAAACRDACEQRYLQCASGCASFENPVLCESRCERGRQACLERC